jgi:hypothetical protein
VKKSTLLNLSAVVLLSLVFTISFSEAQSGRRLHYSTLFNPATVGTLSGEVVRVAQAPSGSGADYCTQAVLRTPQGDISLILAPKGYLAKEGLALAPPRPGDGHRFTDLGHQPTLSPGNGGGRRAHHETPGSQRPAGLGDR